jgi:serpin B
MSAAFDQDKADFSGINGVAQPSEEALHVAAVLHKAFVEVNEKGTEAAATTVMHWAKANGHTPPTFTVDHPFIFAIRDRSSGAILFLGRVADPRGPGSGPGTAPAPEVRPAAPPPAK